MYEIKAIYDGNNFKLEEPIPIKEKYEVIIIFTKPIDNKGIKKQKILKHFGVWNNEDVENINEIVNERVNFFANRRQMIFLDTNIISYYFNGSIEIKEKLLEAIDNDENIATTIINVYEILKGLRWKNNNNKEKLFKDFVENVLVFTIDNNVIELAANIYADLRKQGKIIGDADILIAAIVMNNKGKLVSNNIKHYENIKNLNLVNWFD